MASVLHRRRFRLFPLLAFLSILAIQPVRANPDAGQSRPEDSPDRPAGYRFVDLAPDPVFWGAKGTLTIGFRLLPAVDTAIWLHYGAAWSTKDYYRLADGSLYRADLDRGIDAGAPSYRKLTMPWGAGVMQGLHFNPAKDRNDLSLYLNWRGCWNWNQLAADPGSLLATADDPAKDWNLTNLITLALRYDGTGKDKASNTRQGWALDASAEYAPPGWSIPSGTHYLQLNLALAGYLPLYSSTTADDFNVISLYLCGYTAIDGIIGLGGDRFRGIPFTASQYFGGLERRPGLGGAVRGIGDGWGDGCFKWVGNVELRCNLPAFIHQELMFGLLGFLDCGVYAWPPGVPPDSRLAAGCLATAGAGLFLDFFGLGDIVVRTTFMLNSPNSEGRYWKQIELDFGMLF